MKTYKKLLIAALFITGGNAFAPVADNPPKNFLEGVGNVATLGLVDFHDCDHKDPKKCTSTRHCHTKKCHRDHPNRPYDGDDRDSKPRKKGSRKNKDMNDDV